MPIFAYFPIYSQQSSSGQTLRNPAPHILDNMPAPPILDFSPFYGTDEAAKATLVRRVRESCLTNGFFQIIGHRVTPELQDNVFRVAKEFFALPLEEKEKIHKDHNTWNRGYDRLGSQILEAGTHPDLKEGFFIGEEISESHPYFVGKKLNSGPNFWPSSEKMADAEEFRSVSMEYYSQMHALARDVLAVIALTLSLPEAYFEDFTRGAVATLRYLHYPPQAPDSDEKLSRGIGAHTDFGSVTLLMQDDVGGLQVYDKETEEWLDVSMAVEKGLAMVPVERKLARLAGWEEAVEPYEDALLVDREEERGNAEGFLRAWGWWNAVRGVLMVGAGGVGVWSVLG
ncbi:putative iron ascorbate-dependent oxidoreductase family protein [Teratosphaeria destructans]|uniref:Iron ascorbate-dependent oxidoreductase family protein n=1 Tax=Teratosphaeria destructans TaxID=418781 RepID=A0A9W7W0C9_9PEZI|nr:putative iron ascorbate-dependent oxidoreductase family protein [Teratosphaeria destructans]